MNYLKNSLCYLSGPIDFAKDDGVSWRNIIQERTRDLKIKYLDPCQKPGAILSESSDEKLKVKKLKDEGKFEEVTIFAKKIRRLDLRYVDLSDFVILYVDTDIHMCGSYDEAIMAERQSKPVLCLLKNGKKNAPLWLFGIVKWHEMFDSMSELIQYLDDLNSGRIALDKRWILIRDYL